MSEYACEICNGSRLNLESTSYKVGGKTIKDLSYMDISHFYEWIISVENKLNSTQQKIAKQIHKENIQKMKLFLFLQQQTLNIYLQVGLVV